jgi:hypothetical protein
MERGVKQGCPFGHYLYLFVANVWSVMFVDLTYQVHGLTLPNGYILQDLFFVDDIAFFLKTIKENL